MRKSYPALEQLKENRRRSTNAFKKKLHHGFFTGKFPDSEKFYQQLKLEYLNERRVMGRVCVLWFYIVFNKLCQIHSTKILSFI